MHRRTGKRGPLSANRAPPHLLINVHPFCQLRPRIEVWWNAASPNTANLQSKNLRLFGAVLE